MILTIHIDHTKYKLSSFSVIGGARSQPMREDVTYATSSLIDRDHAQFWMETVLVRNNSTISLEISPFMMTSSFSALLALCTGNSPVTDEFPAQRPVTRTFDVFFYLRLNKRLSKQSWGWWFETSSHQLWRHCYVIILCRTCLPADWDSFYMLYLVHNISDALYLKNKIPSGVPLLLFQRC